MLSDNSSVDHPLCEECTDTLLQVQKKIIIIIIITILLQRLEQQLEQAEQDSQQYQVRLRDSLRSINIGYH